MPWPAGFPPWQQATLEELQTQGLLSGINPLVIAGIEQAETGGWSGGAINSAGYGGYFGLGAETYPGNNTITDQILNTGGAGTTDTAPSPAVQASYTQQAITAAAEFSSLLSTSGSWQAAEGDYQGSPGETGGGVADIAQTLGTTTAGTPTAPSSSGGAGSATTNTSQSNTLTFTGVAGVLQQLQNLMDPAGVSPLSNILSLGTAGVGQALELLVVRGLFTIGFLGLTYLGVKQFTGGGGVPSVAQSIRLVQGSQRIRSTNDRAQLRASTESERTQANERIAATPKIRYSYQRKESTVTHRNPAAEAHQARMSAKEAAKK